MKKFWNLMLVALVVMGAAACTENNESVDTKVEGLSFYAEISNDATRTDLQYDEAKKVWNTVWEGNETIEVFDVASNILYYFTNSKEEPNKFTCTDAGVTSLVGKSVRVGIYNSNLSKDGKRGVTAFNRFDSFDNTKPVQLDATNAFFHYTYNGSGKVTLSMVYEDQPDYKAFRYDSRDYDSVEFEGVKGENWVAFLPYADTPAVLSYSIDGVKCKEKTITVKAGMVYNLGTFDDSHLPKVYLVPNANWKQAGAWFAAHFFNSTDGYADVKLTDDNGDGVYECSVPSGMEEVIFCRMNPAFTEFGWNVEGEEVKHVWDQTAVETIGVEPDNYFYVTDWAKGVWGTKDGYEEPEVEPITWALAGNFNNWGDTLMIETATANLVVAKGVELTAGSEIKVKDSKTWSTSYGGGISNLEANKWMKTYFNGKNIVVAKSGKYDVYFEYAEGAEYSKLYLVEADGDYTSAVEQTEDGTLVPDGGDGGDGGDEPEIPEVVTPGEKSEWALVGAFSSWSDKTMLTTTNANVVVLENVTIKAAEGFLVRKPSTDWADKYGAGDVNYIKANHYITTTQNGVDMCLEADGTYDVYFNTSTKNLYVMVAGTDYADATKQTVSGEEPKQEEPEVTEVVLYLKPNSNWTEANARFAAYFFDGTPGEIWVSMTDADKDGIYECHIPAGYQLGCKLIFCRMNPSTTGNNWNNKWNQTDDLVSPTDGKNLYTVKDGTWDKGGGEWSVK